jgi:hypothetical protein
MFLMLLLLGANRSFAQKHEVGVQVGMTSFLGDVGDNNGFSSFAYSKPAYGILYRFNPGPYFGLRFSVLQTSVQGDDTDSDNPYLQDRKLSFRSNITEISLMGEFNFFQPRRNNQSHHRTPYIFLGLSYFRFNPEAEFSGTWFDLQSLKTEGVSYALDSWAIPFGMGYKFHLGEKYLLAIEAGWRRTYTDYLDDASGEYVEKDAADIFSDYFKDPGGIAIPGSRRANPDNDDYYFIGAITFTYKIKEKLNRCPKPQR